MIEKIKIKLKSLFKQNSKWYPYYYLNERELKQKRICEKWSIHMLSEYYEVDEHFMREVLDFYNIK